MLVALSAWTASAQDLVWGPCEPSVTSEASCASLSVPLAIDAPNFGTTSIALAKLPAQKQPARGQLWFVTGGPGDSGIDDLESIIGLHDVVLDLDIMTLDHRGTGRSGRLGCPTAEDPASAEGPDISPEEWPDCISYVADTYGEELQWLTVTSSAVDLILATETVVQEGQEVYWWGVSYGTYLVQRALYLTPNGPDGVILDGLVPIDWTFTEFDQGLDRTARRWLDACDEDLDCSSHFTSPVQDLAEETLLEIPERCERLGLDAKISRLLTGVVMMPGEPYAGLAPALWARLHRCAPRDRKAFIHLFEELFPEDGGGLGERPGHSPVLQRHIAYADLWSDGADPAALRASLDDVISTTEVSASFAEHAADWPVIPASMLLSGEAIPETWPETEVAVLALHGGFDPTMPIDRISGYADWLDAEHQQLVEIPLAEHVTLNKGDCPLSLYRQFLEDPKRPLDTSCVEGMAAYDWEGEASFNEAIFGTPDRFDDRHCGCQTTSRGWGWLPLAALLTRRRRAS